MDRETLLEKAKQLPESPGVYLMKDAKGVTIYIGKAAVLAEKDQGVTRKLCTFEVEARDADAVAWEPIWHDGAVVGYVTSGGYSHYAQKSIAFGFLPLELIEEGRQVDIEILGEMIPARLYTRPLFDPDNEYLRG